MSACLITPAEIKNHIVTAVGDLLGQYTYENGYQGVAIAVGNIPNNIRVTGVEVIIPNFPTVEYSNQHNEWHHRCEKWNLAIVNHSTDKANWFTVIDRLFRYFPKCYGVDVPQSDPTKNLPMYAFTIVHSGGYENIRPLL